MKNLKPTRSNISSGQVLGLNQYNDKGTLAFENSTSSMPLPSPVEKKKKGKERKRNVRKGKERKRKNVRSPAGQNSNEIAKEAV